MAAETFDTVWYRPNKIRWRDLQLLAYRDVGRLTVHENSIEFRGGKETVVITSIRHVSYGKQGRDFVNNWVKVEYGEGPTSATAFFADGSSLGWGGIAGGTKRILEAVRRAGEESQTVPINFSTSATGGGVPYTLGGNVSEAASGIKLPSQDERTMATLAHVLQMVGSWIAPLVIFLIKRESRFVSFHALQALLLQIVYMVFMAGFTVLWFGSFFIHTAEKSASLPPAFFILFPLMGLGFMGIWIVMLVIAIVYGIKAGRGEWAQYPLLGRLALTILKIGPGGDALSPPAK